ncbi:hypothetical protein D9615_010306 [Tricholomella constricta]|uniref:Uncharacterized protein n=1 Tax=Tricholomella constricta TaxID=117010 RepID=A0A8H5LTA4_9AGAR|nr:hypothetical protein D9615_010306 [Tricholomella constricta]
MGSWTTGNNHSTISAGLKQSLSNSLSRSSSSCIIQTLTSLSTLTISGPSARTTNIAVPTCLLTCAHDGHMPSLSNISSPLPSPMFDPRITLQTRSRVENRVHLELCLCGHSIYRANYIISSMLDPCPPPASSGAVDNGLRVSTSLSPCIPPVENFPRSARTTSTTVAPGVYASSPSSRFLRTTSPPTQRSPAPSFPSLETVAAPRRTTSYAAAPGVFIHPASPRRLAASSLPSSTQHATNSDSSAYAPSPYRPAVPAGQHLLFWTTPHSQLARASFDAQIPVDAQSKIFLGLFNSLAESTRVSYGAGLLRFTQYCDQLHIPENLRMPASDILISAFVADTLGSCTGECIRNWLNGLRFWHLFNYAEWHGHEPLVHSLLKSADKQGLRFKQPPRQPITSRHLLALHHDLDLTSPSGAAIWACALVAFWGCHRLGELLPSKLSFDPSRHVSRDCDLHTSFVNGSKVISFHIPWTKTSPQGIDCILTATHNIFCPVTALENHLRINRLSPPLLFSLMLLPLLSLSSSSPNFFDPCLLFSTPTTFSLFSATVSASAVLRNSSQPVFHLKSL